MMSTVHFDSSNASRVVRALDHLEVLEPRAPPLGA